MFVRRGVFEEVGGFDEGYPFAFNDIDLSPIFAEC
jgi:GT2 family glycosyltransferase